MYRKEIVYDRETRDYAMYVNDELVGYARSYHDAESTLDQLVYEWLRHPHTGAVQQYRATLVETADIASEQNELEVETEETTTTTTNPTVHARFIPLADPVETGDVFELEIKLSGRVTVDPETLQDAYIAALAAPALQTARWQRALHRAIDEIITTGVITISDKALVWSSKTSEATYSATATGCQCAAFSGAQPCKHRAAAIIAALYQPDIVTVWNVRQVTR